MSKLIEFSDCQNGYRDYGGSDNKISIEYNGDLRVEENKSLGNISHHSNTTSR